jgi:hypothetical protein
MDIKQLIEFTDKVKSFNFNTIDIVNNQLTATKFTDTKVVRVVVVGNKWLIETTINDTTNGRLLNEDNAIRELHLLLGGYNEYRRKAILKTVNTLILELVNKYDVNDNELATVNLLNVTESDIKFALLKQIVELKKQLIDIIDNENKG